MKRKGLAALANPEEVSYKWLLRRVTKAFTVLADFVCLNDSSQTSPRVCVHHCVKGSLSPADLERAFDEGIYPTAKRIPAIA